MYYQSALLAALAGTAAATFNPRQLNSVRDLQTGEENIARRQDDAAFECQASVFAIISDIPTPTPDLASYLETFAATANPSDPAALCAVTSAMPTSLTSAFSSYDSAASSWYGEHSAEFAQLASECAGDGFAQSLAQAVTALASYTADDCTGPLPTEGAGLTSFFPAGNATASAAGTGGVPSTPTPTPTTNDDDDAAAEQTSDVAQGAAPAAARPTGAIAGAVAAACLVGAVALM